jgi:ferric-dicitrate binding protein FerR (iron transport regulator)
MTVEDEAARWFATLRRGVMTLQERHEYEAWIASRANRTALGEMEQLWSRLGPAGPPAGGLKHRLTVVATLCAVSLGFVVLAWTSHSAFWTGLDWINR